MLTDAEVVFSVILLLLKAIGVIRVGRILLIGASNNPNRYSNLVMHRLLEGGYTVIPVNPFSEIDTEEQTLKRLADVTVPIEKALVYIRAELLEGDIEELIRINPREVIFSPGAESPVLKKKLERHGISVRNACTLVLLSIGKF